MRGLAVKGRVAALASGAAGLMALFPLYAYYVSEHKIQHVIMGNNVPQLESTPHVDRLEQERQLGELLDGDNPIIIYGNHQVGKTDLLNSVLRSRRGVVQLTMKGPDLAESMLMTKLGTKYINDVEGSMKAAKIKLGQRPIVVFDIPRGQRDNDVLMSVSIFAKEWDVDFKLARVVIIVSATGTAMELHAEGRERRFWVGPLSEKDMESEQVDKFLAEYSGGKAGKHKTEIFANTGGNIGRMKEVAELLKKEDWQQVQASLLTDQLTSVLPFFRAKMGPVFQQLAKEVAAAPVDKGVNAVRFEARTELSPGDFAAAVRKMGAHGIYYNQKTASYLAVTPITHGLLKQLAGGAKPDELIPTD